jgi:hypothetical protein
VEIPLLGPEFQARRLDFHCVALHTSGPWQKDERCRKKRGV